MRNNKFQYEICPTCGGNGLTEMGEECLACAGYGRIRKDYFGLLPERVY